MAKSEEITGVQKAAILLIALGPDKSSNVFKHLKEDEIEQLTLEIANTRSVSPAMKDAVLDEFYEVCLAQQYIAEGGIGYAKDLLEKALGSERAKDDTTNGASAQANLQNRKKWPMPRSKILSATPRHGPTTSPARDSAASCWPDTAKAR